MLAILLHQVPQPWMQCNAMQCNAMQCKCEMMQSFLPACMEPWWGRMVRRDEENREGAVFKLTNFNTTVHNPGIFCIVLDVGVPKVAIEF